MGRSGPPWQGTRPGLAATRAEPSEQHTLVIFDVSDDKARTKLGEMCKDYGLGRFQWSAFEGGMTRTRREELFDRARELLADAPGGGKLFVVAIGQREIETALRTIEPGQPKESAG